MTAKRVGYWLSEKKSRRLSFDDFSVICRQANIDLLKINLSEPLEEQGPFDVVVHKLTDQLVQANQGNRHAADQIETFKRYLERHPLTQMVDRLENISKLIDRNRQYGLVEQTLSHYQESGFFTPTFVEFTTNDVEANKQLLYKNNVTFPLVCKPTTAHGSNLCHQMSLIFNEAGLKDVRPPCVAQSFINHNAVLYKIFAIGRHHCIVERPSIKNFSHGGSEAKTIHFDSHDVSKADSSSHLNAFEKSDFESPFIFPDPAQLQKLGLAIQRSLGLDLIGVDVIVENHTGRYAVIDANSFPGYDGVPEFFNCLLSLIQDKINPSSEQISPGSLSYFPQLTSIWRENKIIESHVMPALRPRLPFQLNGVTRTLPSTDCMKEDKQFLLDSHWLPMDTPSPEVVVVTATESDDSAKRIS